MKSRSQTKITIKEESIYREEESEESNKHKKKSTDKKTHRKTESQIHDKKSKNSTHGNEYINEKNRKNIKSTKKKKKEDEEVNKNEIKKSAEKLITSNHNDKEKAQLKSKNSQNIIKIKSNNDYSDNNKKHSQQNTIKESQKSPTTKRSNKNDNDNSDNNPKISNKKTSKSPTKHKNSNTSDIDDCSENSHKHSKKNNQYPIRKKNHDNDYESDEYSHQELKKIKKKSQSQNHITRGRSKYNDYDYESDESSHRRLKKITKKSKSQNHITKRRSKSNDYDYESGEYSQPKQNRTKKKSNSHNHSTRRRSKYNDSDYDYDSDNESDESQKHSKPRKDQSKKHRQTSHSKSHTHITREKNRGDDMSQDSGKSKERRTKSSKNVERKIYEENEESDSRKTRRRSRTTGNEVKNRNKGEIDSNKTKSPKKTDIQNNNKDNDEESDSRKTRRRSRTANNEVKNRNKGEIDSSETKPPKSSKKADINNNNKDNDEESDSRKTRRRSRTANNEVKNRNKGEIDSNETKSPKKTKIKNHNKDDDEESNSRKTRRQTKPKKQNEEDETKSPESHGQPEDQSYDEDEYWNEEKKTRRPENNEREDRRIKDNKIKQTDSKGQIKSPSKEDDRIKQTDSKGQIKSPSKKDDKIKQTDSKGQIKSPSKGDNINGQKEEQDTSESNQRLTKDKSDNHVITNETCPFIGLSNLGATCYMNSAIQVLFHTPLFCKNVLTYDIGDVDINDLITATDTLNKSKRILLNLQHLFYQMCECMNQQSNHKMHKDYISTAPLARSFGWSKQEISMQQDVHEFIINFFEVLDSCSSSKNNSMTELFKGQIITTITNKRDGKLVLHSFETFYDFSLLVKGLKDIHQSLSLFTKKDELKSDIKNKDELIQVQFYSLPKVLHIHLRRFVYSQDRCRTDKVNDYFSFPENLDMSPYVFKEKSIPRKSKKTENISPYNGECNYVLYGVIVHQGKMSYVGHYYAYLKLNPDCNHDYQIDKDEWYLFNDTKVSKVTKEEATTLNFGERVNDDDGSSSSDSDFHCAYILLYARKDSINEIFNIKKKEVKIPQNVLNLFDEIEQTKSKQTMNKAGKSDNSFANVCTNSTIGFTLITEDCIRMNCKLGKAGIDNRLLSKRVNIPFDQLFTFQDDRGTFSIGGIYATISVFLNVDLNRLNLWTVTSSYEIKEQLNKADFEITKKMLPDEIERVKEKATDVISPRVIFVEIEKNENNHFDDDTEDTEESSNAVKNLTSVITKLYTRETQCPMLYTGVLSNLSYSHSLNSIIKHHYQKRLIEMTCETTQGKGKEESIKAFIERIDFDVFYEKKRSNIKGDSDLYKLSLTKSLKSNNVPKGGILIFSIKTITTENLNSTENELQVAEQKIIRWINDLITFDKSQHNNYEFLSSSSPSSNVHRYCDMMVSECPFCPVDFCDLFTNTETLDVYRYIDNCYFGKVELPSKLSVNQLSDFISFQFDIQFDRKESKMLIFSDGPAFRPIDACASSKGTIMFNVTENFRKSFYFEIVPKTFKYSESCYTLSVAFSADSVSLTQKYNFFIETENEEESQQQQKDAKSTDVDKAETVESIVNRVLENYSTSKKINLNELRCFWVSKESSQIVSDFIFLNTKKKKKDFINSDDILILNRELRIEVTPKDQMSEMKSLKKLSLKSKNADNYCGVRLEVYKSYVQDNLDGFDNEENNDSLPLLKVFDFPFVLVNIDPNSKVKKLKEQISTALLNEGNKEKNDYLSIKYASLFIPSLEKNLFNKEQIDSNTKNDDYFQDDDDDEDENKNKNKNNKANKDVPVGSFIRDDYSFAFDANSILKNDEKIQLMKNQPNKLFLVYSQDRALGNANDGVVFF